MSEPSDKWRVEEWDQAYMLCCGDRTVVNFYDKEHNDAHHIANTMNAMVELDTLVEELRHAEGCSVKWVKINDVDRESTPCDCGLCEVFAVFDRWNGADK